MTDIIQIINRTGTPCPKCKEPNQPYGHVDTPPIALQIDDNNHCRDRRWLAVRHHCDKCGCMYDLVMLNDVVYQATPTN